MSQTLVSPRYISQQHRSPHSPHSSPGSKSPALRPYSPAKTHVHSPQGPPPSKQALPSPPPPPPFSAAQGVPVEYYQLTPEEERRRREAVELATPLSVLASQHHRSEYNRLKWGDKGSRLYYVPLSIQLPSHVDELMEKQAVFERYCATQAQTINDDLLRSPPSIADSSSPSSSTSSSTNNIMIEFGGDRQGGRMTPPRDLEQEEGLEGTLVGSETENQAASKDDSSTWVVREIKDQILQAMEDQLVVPGTGSLPTPPSSQPSPTPSNAPLLVSNGNTSLLALKTTPQVLPPVRQTTVFSSIEAGRQDYARQEAEGGQQQMMVPQGVKTSDTHPINISILIPPSYTPLLAPLLSVVLPPSPPPPGFPKTDCFECAQPFRLPTLLDLHHLSLNSPSVDSAPDPYAGMTSREGRVGNFLLSSCPGKKVRLTGPVKGRGAICRDLKVDLERIKGLGVGCVVCCLDDEELSYLGAPYGEYAKNAKLVGLDVIRIPMPEGLTPTSLPVFDSQISHIIRTYTLRGIDVLSHCRGGVGRASIVAGSWAIKMGLITPTSIPVTPRSSTSVSVTREEKERRRGEVEDYATVERVIAVLRRRRSLKAIETYEQVRWLMEYVGWLRVEGRVLERAETH